MPIRYRDLGIPDTLLWSVADLGQALEYLAQKKDYPVVPANTLKMTPPHLETLDEKTLDRWIDALALQLGLEIEPIQSTYSDADHILLAAGPSLIQVADTSKGTAPRFIALLNGGKRRIHLIAQDGSVQRIHRDLIQDALWAETASGYTQSIQQMLDHAGVAEQRHQSIQRAILKEVLGSRIRRGGWMLRLSPSTHLWQQARQIGMGRTAATLIGSYVMQLLLSLAAWWMIGQSALVGHFDWGWLSGWALLLLTTVPFQAWSNLAQNRLAIGIGVLFKQRLMHGVLQLDPEEVRHQGAGQFLGRVLASDTVEQLGLASGFVAILAFFQLAAAVGILANGIGGWLHAGLLLIWVGCAIGLGWIYWRRSQSWIVAYREMTNDLVERMVGHRTRLAQEERQSWHTEEDQALNIYFQLQKKVDEIEGQLKALIPRGWMLVGVSSLVYTLLFTQPTPGEILVTLGGILFAYQALTTIILGLKSLVNARLAWQEISMLFHASTRSHTTHNQVNPSPQYQQEKYQQEKYQKEDMPSDQKPIITARDIGFHYPGQGRSVLQGCNLQIYRGDRLLLEGPSGGGKSTLASLLSGLRSPESGLLLLHGVDQETMGVMNWRQSVVAVPQFHENYVLTGTMAFNLLMGRRWPPQREDLIEAETICRELGLGELLDRMPAGLQQMVGESGWQLSHGERSRLYIARAILQGAELVVMDESFGSLDPESLEEALRTVLARVPTLVVIAHP